MLIRRKDTAIGAIRKHATQSEMHDINVAITESPEIKFLLEELSKLNARAIPTLVVGKDNLVKLESILPDNLEFIKNEYLKQYANMLEIILARFGFEIVGDLE